MATYLMAGLLAGATGLLTFLVIHHVWIRPIWSILPAGLVIAGLGGIVMGWAYGELSPYLPPRPWTVVAILALVTAILAPSVLIGQLRPALLDAATFSIRPGEGASVAIHFLVELVLTSAIVGGVAGWLIAHNLRAALATSLAGLVIALGPGHNVPLLGNTPAMLKGVVLLFAIVAVASVVLVETGSWLAKR